MDAQPKAGVAMRRARSRLRNVTVTPELVRLFREALAADEALRQDSGRAKRRRMTPEEHNEALAVIHAFHQAANHPLWERFSPLHPRASDHALQEALLAQLSAEELKTWEAYCRRY